MVMEELCRSYVLNFGLGIAIVRLFSVYGPGLRKQLLWDVCRQLASGEAVIHLGGGGGERRDWLHVSDAVGLLSAALDLCGKESWVVNGGAGRGTSVRAVATLIAETWGHAVGFFFSGISRPGDPHTMIADTSRATALGFSASVELATGIAEYVEWAKREHLGR
jgi:UDP-glucose 4-epimerase